VSAPTHYHDHGHLPPPVTREVAEDIFAYVQPDGSWWINNTGFIVGSDHVCAIDAASTERRTAAFQAAIARATDLPTRTLLNTHHHGDHTNGNCLFGDAVIVAHENCRENMAGQRIGGLDAVFGPVEWGDLAVVPPALTFRDAISLHVGDVRVDVLYAGVPAHTTGDAVAWIPSRRVLFTGDLVFNGGTPFVLMGSVSGSIQALARIRELGAVTIVPGHGGICGPDALDVVERYLRWIQSLAADAKAAGLSPLDAARETDLGEWADLLDCERVVGNLHRAYAELDGEALGAPIDIAAAFADMIAFNGGQPLRCMA
jgi:cyclase